MLTIWQNMENISENVVQKFIQLSGKFGSVISKFQKYPYQLVVHDSHVVVHNADHCQPYLVLYIADPYGYFQPTNRINQPRTEIGY